MKKYRRPKLKVQTKDEVLSEELDLPSKLKSPGKPRPKDRVKDLKKKLNKEITSIEKFLQKMKSNGYAIDGSPNSEQGYLETYISRSIHKYLQRLVILKKQLRELDENT